MRSLLQGRPVALPSVLDGCARRWARLAPRVRFLLIILAGTSVLLASEIRVSAAYARWGGAPVSVWVAASDAGIGDVPELRRTRLPPQALPAAPVTVLPTVSPLTMALPEGAVLTERHISPAGPAIGLPSTARLVPVPVDQGWGVTAGGRVDVWIGRVGAPTDTRQSGAELVARGRLVVEVRTDASDDLTALVSIDADDVTDVARGLVEGSVLLSHVPG